MPRTDGIKLKSAVLSTHTAMISSAVRVGKLPPTLTRANSTIKAEEWQRLAWLFYDTIGEYRYSVAWVGNLLSKATLYITKDGEKFDGNQVANDLLESLYGGDHGEMLRQLGTHFTVAGDSYIMGVDNGTGKDDDWFIAASTDLRRVGTGNTWIVHDEEFSNPLIIRMWHPHPRNRLLSDAPSRAVLPILTEIDGLTKHVSAQIDSRLAGAGILLVPSDISFSGGTKTDSDGVDVPQPTMSADAFVDMLLEVMQTAIADRANASALVPIVLQAAGEHLDKIKHLTFWTQLDNQAIELRAEAIGRLALGMDMPPEVLTGTGDMNHWSSWQAEEAAIKVHTEPLLMEIAASFSAGYLRPGLVSDPNGLDVDEAAHYGIGVDTSKLRLRPNRSKEAGELYDRGVLSKETLLRENGFETSDVMDKEEFRLWMLQKVASGSTTPELVAAALTFFETGIVIPVAAPKETTQEARPTPSLKEHPVRAIPQKSNEIEDDPALVAAAWSMTYRALERAGNRLRSKMNAKIVGVSAFATYQHVDFDLESNLDFLLADAWSPAEEFAADYGTDPVWLISTLDSYARELMVKKLPLTMEGTADWVASKRLVIE